MNICLSWKVKGIYFQQLMSSTCHFHIHYYRHGTPYTISLSADINQPAPRHSGRKQSFYRCGTRGVISRFLSVRPRDATYDFGKVSRRDDTYFRALLAVAFIRARIIAIISACFSLQNRAFPLDNFIIPLPRLPFDSSPVCFFFYSFLCIVRLRI